MNLAVLPKYRCNTMDDVNKLLSENRSSGAYHPPSQRVKKESAQYLIAILIALAALFPLATPAQEQVLEVIQLSNRPAEEVVELVRPFLGRRGTVVASGTKLIVKTSPQNMAEVHQLIDQLDKSLAQFQISVLQTNKLSLAELNAEANVYGSVSNNGTNVRARGNLYQSDSKTDGEVTQQIRTMEGRAAHIQVGQEFPVPAYSIGYGGFPAAGVQYQQATTGFAVVPRSVGNEVLLEVSPWSDRLSRRGGGVVHTQSAHTTIRAPLGKWVNFGGLDNSEASSSRGILRKYDRSNKDVMKIFIKVDKIR